MDLFTFGGNPLLPVLPTIKELFAKVAGDAETVEASMLWSLKLRGFRDGFSDYKGNEHCNDLGVDLLRKHTFDMKRPLVSSRTAFQTVDVYEVLDPQVNSLAAYYKSLSNDGSYEANHPEFYQPDKILFLDRVQQSTLFGDAAYHEALVHPAMMSHPNPKRVAIIGGKSANKRNTLSHPHCSTWRVPTLFHTHRR